MAITIELPQDIERDLESRWPDLSRKALEALVLEGYRHGALSRGQIARLLGLSVYEADGFLKENGVYFLYNEDDLRHDMEAAEQLFSP